MDHFGTISLLPAVLVIATALTTRRPIFSLVVGTVVGLIILSPTPADIIPRFSNLAVEMVQDDTVAWVIVVCGLMGSLIVLLLRTGAVIAFSDLIASRIKNRQSALLATWVLGLLIFIDDYLNALSVSTSMKKVTDKYQVSREMLAYVVDSTAAPICILVPISTWAVFFSGVLESSGFAAKGQGMELYISAIPYMLYAWIAVALVPLVALGRIPLLGPMKAAELRAKNGTAVIMESAELDVDRDAHSVGAAHSKNHSIWNFLIPMLSLLFFTWLYDIDVLIGVVVSLGISVPLFGFQGLLPWGDIFEAVLDGIKLMVPALTVVVVAFMFKSVNDQLGLPAYVIETVQPVMTAKLLPVLTFVTMAVVAFATSSFWGIFAIAIPIFMPLAEALGVPTPLVLGALLSASSFGSHACFYSDSTVLAAQGSGCDVMDHALTQFPYVLISAVLAAIGLTILA